MMKALFIESKYDKKIKLNENLIKKLPSTIGLVSAVQFSGALKDLKNQIKKLGKKAVIGKGKQKYAGQVLGCDVSAAEKINGEVDCFLYIGDGKFHPAEIALKTRKPIFTFNPFNNKLNKINKKEIELIEKRRKAAYSKFLYSKNIGILVSTKPGQNKLKQAIDLKNRLKGKNCYILIFDTLGINELENFNFIDCFVNTACPRIVDDVGKAVVNINEIQNL